MLRRRALAVLGVKIERLFETVRGQFLVEITGTGSPAATTSAR